MRPAAERSWPGVAGESGSEVARHDLWLRKSGERMRVDEVSDKVRDEVHV